MSELEDMREEALRVNLGAGEERLSGWLSLDVEPERNISLQSVEVTPDIIACLPDLPFGDNSVDAFRMRDLLLDYRAEGFNMSKLGREIQRALKPGGVLITIEHRNIWPRFFSRVLRRVSVERDERIDYMEEDEVEDPKDLYYWRTVYVKA